MIYLFYCFLELNFEEKMMFNVFKVGRSPCAYIITSRTSVSVWWGWALKRNAIVQIQCYILHYDCSKLQHLFKKKMSNFVLALGRSEGSVIWRKEKRALSEESWPFPTANLYVSKVTIFKVTNFAKMGLSFHL